MAEGRSSTDNKATQPSWGLGLTELGNKIISTGRRDQRQGLDLIQPKVHQLILGPRSRYIVTTQTQP